MKYKRLGRRTFLRGAGGLGIALPLLDVMLDDHGTALAFGGRIPPRFLVCFGGYSLGCDDDPATVPIVPDVVGPNYDLKAALMPFAGHGNVQQEISVVSGLRIPSQTAKDTNIPIPQAGRTVGFHFHTNPLISGNRSLTDGFFDSTVTGPSADQVMAQHLGKETTFAYLSYRAQALYYNSAPSAIDKPLNRDTLSFDESGTPIAPTVSPRLAYDALFTGFTPPDPADAAAVAFELEKRKSILDLVDRTMDGVVPTLGAADQQKLERHLDEVRALEKRLDAIPPEQTGACELLVDPGDDPPLGGEPTSPTHYDVNLGYSGEDERLRIFTDLMHMAFTCDLTRVGALMFTMWQSFMNVEPITGHQWNHHQLNHQGTGGTLADAVAWHMDHFGYLVAKLRDTPEGAGSLLDHCAIVFLNEGGHGYGYEGGKEYSSHSTDDMVALVAGGAGGLLRGQHIVAPQGLDHPVNVVITAMQAAGASLTTHGEVQGSIDALLG